MYYSVDDLTFESTQYDELNKWAWANHQNPDWLWMTEPEEEETQGIQSDQVHTLAGDLPIIAARITLNTNQAGYIDRWYGSSNFRCLGVAMWGNGEDPSNGAIFLDRPLVSLQAPNYTYTSLYILLKPGVTGNVLLTPHARYPFIGSAVYPSGDDPYWAAWNYPRYLGLREGKLYAGTPPP